jgi:hypothetical protein
VKEITNAHYAATLYHEILEATPKDESVKKEDDAEEKKEEATDGKEDPDKQEDES